MTRIVSPPHRRCLLLPVTTTLILPFLLFPTIAGTGERAEEGGGFQSNHIFLDGPGGDSISPFSGDAETTIRIGPTLKAGGGLDLGLTLQHSTKIWTRWNASTDGGRYLKRRGPFGVGWRLHLGRVYASCREGCGSANNWVFESSDGAQHPLQRDVTADMDPSSTNRYNGTTDATWIRAEALDSSGVVLDSWTSGPIAKWRLFLGNGVVYLLDRRLESLDTNHPTSGSGADESDDFRGWYTTAIEKWDTPEHPVGRIAVSYETTAALAHCLKQIDFQAMAAGVLTTQRSIVFVNDTSLPGFPSVEGGFTREIRFPAMSGTTPTEASYHFFYSGPHTLQFNPASLPTIYPDQLLLTRIEFPYPDAAPATPPYTPRAGQYAMDFTYDLDPVGDNVTGDLIRRKLPTGATIEYAYATYSYNASDIQTVYLREVTTKRLYLGNPDSTPADGVWTYARTRFLAAHPQYTTITDPFGNESVHLFGSQECTSQCSDPSFTSLTTSVKTYQGTAATGTLLRTEKSRYLFDAQGRNIVPVAGWAVFHDQQGKISGSRSEGYGPFGHLTTTSEYGLVSPTANGELPYPGNELPYRQTVTTWAATPASTDDRWKLWFIHQIDASEVRDAAGNVLRKATSQYATDGRPLKRTAWLDPADANEEALGNVVSESRYDPATALLERSFTRAGGGGIAFGARLQYENNTFVKKRWTLNSADPNGATSQAFAYDNRETERDLASGSVKAMLDAADLRTELTYDPLGRLVNVIPATDATELPTVVEYPSITETRVKRGDTAGSNFIQTKYTYDSLGRLTEVKARTKSGCETIQKTDYDIAGRILKQYESGFDAACAAGQPAFDPAKFTRFSYRLGPDDTGAWDAMGRLRSVKTADNKLTTTSYPSASITSVTIADLDGSASTTTYERDAFGRLAFVDAPQGADARYTYSVTGELTSVELTSVPVAPATGPPQVQPRNFSFDKLGRLTSATNPESGTVFITAYDAAGRVLQKLDSDGTTLTYTYDAAGRIVTASATPAGTTTARLQAQYFYDEAGVPNGSGRLTRVDSYDETGALVSRKTLRYGGRNGRLSEEATSFAFWDGREGIQATRDKELKTCYFYDAFGLLSSTRYPAAAACVEGAAPTGVARLVYGYSNGALNSIQDASRNVSLISAVTYNPWGGFRQITHGNTRVTDVVSDSMGRPASITVPDPANPSAPHFATGTYAYDGAGNITQMGSDTFDYDRLSRLVRADVNFQDGTGAHVEHIRYAFDGFGNLKGKDRWRDGASEPPDDDNYTEPLPADPATNRLTAFGGSAAVYDQKGNLLGNNAAGYLFDERNRLLAARDDIKTYPVGQYGYDAGGIRFLKEKPGTGERTFYVRDGGGNVLTEYTLPPNSYTEFYQKDYFYALGRVIGMAEEKAPGPVQGVWTSMSFVPGEEEDPPQMSVTIQWTLNPEPGVTAYRIFRKTGALGTWSQRGADKSPTTTTFNETGSGGLQAGQTYYYRVAAVIGTLEGIPSRSLQFVMAENATPTAPTAPTLTKRLRSLTLRWTRSTEDSGFTGSLSENDPATMFLGYHVYRRKDAETTWVRVTLLPTTGTVFHDLNADNPASVYYFQVRAISTGGQESDGAMAQTSGSPGDDVPPAAPTGVRALSGPGTGEVTVVWNPSMEADLTQYQVYRWDGTSYIPLSPVVLNGSPREFTLAGLTVGQEYTFTVAARDATAWSALSATARAKPRISLAAPPGQIAYRRSMWLDNSGYALLTWSTVPGAAKYRVYRRKDREPWNFQPIYSNTGPGPHTDSSVNWCQAHAYIVRAADADGNEGADPVDEMFSQPIVRPTAPVADPNLPNRTITLTWGGFNGCDPAVSGFEVTAWVVHTKMTSGSIDPAGDHVLPASATSYTTAPYPAENDDLPHAFAISAQLRNLYHWQADPNDALGEFHSIISEDLCASLLVGDLGDNCPDLSGNNGWNLGPPGGLPPYIEDSGWNGPGHRMHIGQRPSALDEIPMMADAGASASPLDGSGPSAEEVLLAGLPIPQTGNLLVALEAAAAAAPATSPHRVIGSPSPKDFKFTWFHCDHLGSVRLESDATGAAGTPRRFLPFGEPLEIPASRNSHQFTGHERDAESGLDDMLERQYLSSASRFLVADPFLSVRLNTLLPQRWNRYSYALLNPVSYKDANGMDVTIPGSMRENVKASYMTSPIFREQFNKAKNNKDVTVEAKMSGPKPGDTKADFTLNKYPQPVPRGEGEAPRYKVDGIAEVVTPVTVAEFGAQLGHELSHANQIAKEGCAGSAKCTSQAQEDVAVSVREEIRGQIENNDPSDDVSAEEADRALEGTEPSKSENEGKSEKKGPGITRDAGYNPASQTSELRNKGKAVRQDGGDHSDVIGGGLLQRRD